MDQVSKANKLTEIAKTYFPEMDANSPDIRAMLFVIGVRELGKTQVHFTKEEKIDLIHVGICTALINRGYYVKKIVDKDGWPHFENIKKLPSEQQQQSLLQEAIIDYFTEL